MEKAPQKQSPLRLFRDLSKAIIKTCEQNKDPQKIFNFQKPKDYVCIEKEFLIVA